MLKALQAVCSLVRILMSIKVVQTIKAMWLLIQKIFKYGASVFLLAIYQAKCEPSSVDPSAIAMRNVAAEKQLISKRLRSTEVAGK